MNGRARKSAFQEDKVKSTYDSRIMKWFLRYLKPYRHLIGFSLLFLIFTTFFDLALPYITKIAIDHYIMPSYGEIVLQGKNPEFEEDLLRKYGEFLIPLGENRYLVDLSKIPKEERVFLEKKRYIARERYVVVRPDMGESALEQARSHPEVFKKVGELYIAPQSALGKLEKKSLMAIRGRDLSGVKKMALVFFLFLFLNSHAI